MVPGPLLLHALHVRADSVRRLHQLPRVILLRAEVGREGRLHALGQHGGQAIRRHVLQRLVGPAQGIGVVLDGGGHVAGDDLRGVVVDRQGQHMLRFHGLVVAVPGDHRQSVGDHGHLQGMLRVVLRQGAAHQPPAADVLQPCHVSKKVMHHDPPSSFPIIHENTPRCDPFHEKFIDNACLCAIMFHDNRIHRWGSGLHGC